VNLFGADVRTLDAVAFLAQARLLFSLAAVAGLALMLMAPRLRRPGFLLAGVLAANAWAWLETTWPLQRLYALGPSSDRLNNVAMCQGVAAGGSPLATPQVGHVHFEPFWGLLVAVSSGFDPARVLDVYAVMPLVAVCAFAASLYFALRPLRGDPGGGWSPWERALIAGAATLLSSAPLDYALTYRVPWAMTFLLKPNHAMGLVLLPWVLRAFAGITGWRSRLAAGALLHVMGWAFVVHMGATCAGFAALAVLGLVLRHPEAGRDARDAAAVIGINLLIVSPYLILLFATYGVFHGIARHQIPPWSAHLLEATARIGWLLPLAAWGGVTLWRRDRLGRAWAAQAAGALALWLAFYPLSAIQLAKERDDLYYWLRVLAAVLAAAGAWDLARRAAEHLRGGWARLAAPEWRAAALALLALPWSVPYWWDPARMDLYFAGSREPLPASVTETAAAVAGRADALVAGDPVSARWIAALTGRRVLLAQDFPAPSDWARRATLNERLLAGDPEALPEARQRGITHFVVTSGELKARGLEMDDVRRRPHLVELVEARDAEGGSVALFELRPVDPPGPRG
jgi:hypothetical protein